MAGKNSNYNRKSGGAGFLITAGIIFFALKGFPGLLLGMVIGAGVGAVASIMGKKLDTTTQSDISSIVNEIVVTVAKEGVTLVIFGS